ncbi:antitoxin VbhA family protein [Mycobacterium kansasii]
MRVGTAVESELAAMWAYVDARTRRLSPADRLAVRNAIAGSVLEGCQPAPASIDLLVEFAAGAITIEQYQARVLADVRWPRQHNADSRPN